jgi:hypothetical protein
MLPSYDTHCISTELVTDYLDSPNKRRPWVSLETTTTLYETMVWFDIAQDGPAYRSHSVGLNPQSVHICHQHLAIAQQANSYGPLQQELSTLPRPLPD